MRNSLYLVVLALTFNLYSVSSKAQVSLEQRDSGTEQDLESTETKKPRRAEVSSDTSHDADENDTTHLTLVTTGSEPVDTIPKQRLKNGTFVYATKPSPHHHSAAVRFGSYTLTNLQSSAVAGVSYKDIYQTNKPFLISIDYEFQVLQSFGKIGLKPGIGFFTAKGFGRFLHSSSTVSDAGFTMYGIPMSASGLYHLQFSDTQIFAPYGELGLDYFGLIESRNDKQKIADSLKVGGGAAWHWSAGLQIQLDFLDREAVMNLDRELGVSHLFLVADVKQFLGLSSVFDFTGLVYEGGILVEF